MNPTIVEYIIYVVVALILIFAVIEFNRRYLRHKLFEQESSRASWVTLDTRQQDAGAPPSKDVASEPEDGYDDNDNDGNADLHSRAKQNGHYTEIKRL